MSTSANAISPQSFILSAVRLESDGFKEGHSVELKGITTDIDIYEHLEKPYLTGRIVIVDSHGLFDTINFLGSEKLTIEFNRPDSELFTKSSTS